MSLIPHISESEIFEFLQHYERASQSRDFSTVMDFIHPDALFRFNDGDYAGRQAIQAAFVNTWAHDVINEHYEISDKRIIYANTESAVVAFTFRWSGLVKSQSFQNKGRGTSVIVRAGTRLQIVCEHLSRD